MTLQKLRCDMCMGIGRSAVTGICGFCLGSGFVYQSQPFVLTVIPRSILHVHVEEGEEKEGEPR